MQLEASSGYDPRVHAIDDGMDEQPDLDAIRASAVQYGIYNIDRVTPSGIDVRDGEFVVVQGPDKGRKTTTALNIARNICRSGRLNGSVVWETLESGESPRKVKQRFIAMEATAILAMHVWKSVPNFPSKEFECWEDGERQVYRVTDMESVENYVANGENASLFRLSVKRVMGGSRTKLQQWAIEQARARVNEWPLVIFGAPEKMGDTKRLDMPSNGDGISSCLPYKRWLFAKKQYNARVVFVDHSAAYVCQNDYDKANRFVAHASAFVAQENAALFSLAQTSMGSGGEYAMGGKKQAQEGTVVFATEYSDPKGHKVIVDPLRSRDEPPPKMYVPIERFSGLFFPMSYPIHAKQR